MTPGVFNLNYLSFYLAKNQKYGKDSIENKFAYISISLTSPTTSPDTKEVNLLLLGDKVSIHLCI